MKRNKHSLSHYKLASMKMGELVPVGCYEVLPGDTIQQATTALVRMSPLNAPVMHPTHVKIHHWFVPNRLIWDDWENFITGGPDGLNASAYPTMTAPAVTGYAEGTLADYLGIPPGVPDIFHSALPFRAYQLIMAEWYRDQDLQTFPTISKASGLDTTTNKSLFYTNWEKDYFTTARPEPQKGPDVLIPMGEASVERVTNAGAWDVYNAGSNTASTAAGVDIDGVGSLAGLSGQQLSLDPAGGLTADVTAAAGTIRELAERVAMFRYEEARSVYGSRYTEYLRYLGVRSSDARLQRPEYLGGGKQTIQFSEVLTTANNSDTGTSEDIGTGQLYGHGIGAARSNRYRRFFEEHGWVMTFMTVMPKPIYGNGLDKMWNRRTKFDFWQKEFEKIGQEEVLKKEAYAADTDGDGVLGYQDRYDSYRQILSRVAGEFRSSLDYWHFARLFSSDIELNSAFVNGADVTDRVFQTGSAADTLWCMISHSIQARRMVSNSGYGLRI